jgi:dihydrofolate reductase
VIVSLIVAMAENRAIGHRGALPWKLSADLARFKRLTTGHHIIMGRKTYESIGRPLPGRTSVVVTRRPDFAAASCLVAHSLDEALRLARERGEREAFVIGGAEIYRAALPLADRLYLTLVEAHPEADTFFPEFDESEWSRGEEEFVAADERNQYATRFVTLSRAR